MYHFLALETTLGTVNALPELLIERREDAGMSQRAVARELGVSPQTYIWWERGAVMPKPTWATELAAWLGISKTDVLVAMGILEPDERIVREAPEALAGGEAAPLS
jgi:DNA-binding XRE family transcriptional regulator